MFFKKYIAYILLLLVNASTLNAQIVEADKEYDIKKGENYHGFKDAKGNWVVKPIYRFTYWYKDWQYGICKQTDNGPSALVDKYGKIVVGFDSYISYFINDGFIQCEAADGSKALCDIHGKVIIPLGKYKRYYIDGEGFVHCEDANGTTALCDNKGNEIIPLGKYKSITIMSSNLAYVYSLGGKQGALDLEKRSICVPLEYEQVWLDKDECVNSELFFIVKRNGKYGAFAQGREVISCEYDDWLSFTNGVATAKKDGEVKLIKNPLRQEGGAQIMMAGNAQGAKKKRGPAVSRYPAPNSDVDKNIPVAKSSNKNSFAVIVANENYPDAPVPYSLNDGRMFKEYCNKTLGIPEKNISLYEDATYGNLIEAVEKIKNIAEAFDGEASLIFYYAGHGFPDEKQSTAYLLPIDGNAGDITSTGYSLAKLYDQLARINLKSSIVFLDACFSGAKREDQMLSQSRGVAIKVREEEPKGKMVVFSAAQGDETAHQLEEKGHGLFTYYLLKQLQAKGGELTMGELSDFVTKQVKRQSVVINNKKQTPEIIPSPSLSTTWRDMKLK